MSHYHSGNTARRGGEVTTTSATPPGANNNTNNPWLSQVGSGERHIREDPQTHARHTYSRDDRTGTTSYTYEYDSTRDPRFGNNNNGQRTVLVQRSFATHFGGGNNGGQDYHHNHHQHHSEAPVVVEETDATLDDTFLPPCAARHAVVEEPDSDGEEPTQRRQQEVRGAAHGASPTLGRRRHTHQRSRPAASYAEESPMMMDPFAHMHSSMASLFQRAQDLHGMHGFGHDAFFGGPMMMMAGPPQRRGGNNAPGRINRDPFFSMGFDDNWPFAGMWR